MGVTLPIGNTRGSQVGQIVCGHSGTTLPIGNTRGSQVGQIVCGHSGTSSDPHGSQHPGGSQRGAEGDGPLSNFT
ncbi:hypothetical protein QE152_g37214 [Popillia japonica]|uniref:Uncharacterized protein n=1 Tax=Popillia japonica TaxID=7064 RepID=A0AAW1IB53_POPJA